jgi:RimJ/RimL family protein N-acetyltransferase
VVNEENFIDFKCPFCKAMASYPESDAGFVRACPNCMEDLLVPSDGNGTGLTIPLPVTTPRLRLRRLALDDGKDLMGVTQQDEEAVTAWLERDTQVRLTTPQQTFYLGIELCEREKLIGYFGLTLADADRRLATFTFELNPQFQNGEADAEAIDALLGFCFERIHLHRLMTMADSGDTSRCKLFERVGMRREAEFIKDRWVEGEWKSSIWYAALDEDYESSEEGNIP